MKASDSLTGIRSEERTQRYCSLWRRGPSARLEGLPLWWELFYFCEITNLTFAAARGRTLTVCSQVFGSLKTARCTCF